MPTLPCLFGAVLAVAVAAAPAWAQNDPLVRDTVLDAGFGGDGRVVVPIDLRPGQDIVERAVKDRLGGYWLVGRAEVAGGAPRKHYVMVAARIAHDGSLQAMAVRNDVAYDFESGTGPAYSVNSVAADASGRLLLSVVVCTNRQLLETCTARVLRIATDGSPDPSFDVDGEVRVAVAVASWDGVVARPDGETWVGGYTYGTGTPRIFRFDANGAALSPLDAPGIFVQFADLADDRLLAVANEAGVAASVYRLEARGNVDIAYGIGGKITVPEPPGDCGYTSADYDVRQLDALRDGRAALEFNITRFDPTPVASFVAGIGPDGQVGVRCIAHANPDYEGLAGSAAGIALRDDGRIFVGIPSLPTAQGNALGMLALQLQPGTLSLDAGFNGGQPFPIPFPNLQGFTDAGTSAVLIDRGAPVVVGTARVDGFGYDYAAARTEGTPRIFRASFE
jgi:hypothetical protein